MRIIFFRKKDLVSYEILFLNNSIKNIADKYYNLNSSLNHLLNDFLYYQHQCLTEDDWIFFLKVCPLVPEQFEHPPIARSFTLEDILQLNGVIKKLRKILKSQNQCGNALLNQSRKYYLLKITNEERIKSDMRYTIGSLRTTNRTHKQRMINLELYYNSLPYKYTTIEEIFSSLLCLITIESRNLSQRTRDDFPESTQKNCKDILNLAWETTTHYAAKAQFLDALKTE